MSTKTKKSRKDALQPGAEHCAVPGCAGEACYKAPKSRHNLRDYQWLCLEHVRQFNQAWDYFAGMGTEEIESFRRDAVTGHRPTWKPTETLTLTPDMLHEVLQSFLQDFAVAAPVKPVARRLPKPVEKAFQVLELTPVESFAPLKQHYKALVKRTHPDVNRSDPEAEERFKRITEAYRYLSEHRNLWEQKRPS